VESLVEVFRGARRALRSDGLLFVNLGDKFAPDGNLLGIPWRVGEALKRDGWILRDAIIWAKAEVVDDEEEGTRKLEGYCMPESQNDRCTLAYEIVLQLAVDRRYYFDRVGVLLDSGAPLRNVWRLNIEPSPLGHFAMMPRKLAEWCIRLGTSEKGCCPSCGAPWRRLVEKERVPTRTGEKSKIPFVDPANSPYAKHSGSVIGNRDAKRHAIRYHTVGWEPGCKCGIGETVPCRVLDPFGGLSTVAVVARELGRAVTTIELNPEYHEAAVRRVEAGGWAASTRGDSP
jgi:hypothetical protein